MPTRGIGKIINIYNKKTNLMEDPDSQEDTGEYHKQVRTRLNHEKVLERTYGKRIGRLSIRRGSISVPSRLLRAFRMGNEEVQPFLRWYSFSFLPIIWAVFFGLYYIAT